MRLRRILDLLQARRPAVGRVVPRVREGRNPVKRRPPSAEEVAGLLRAAKAACGGRLWRHVHSEMLRAARRDYLYLATLANTGLRVSEVLDLCVADIFEREGVLRVRTRKRKGRPLDDQPAPKRLLADLADWGRWLEQTDWQPRGTRPAGRGGKRRLFAFQPRRARYIFRRCASAAGWPRSVRAHDLRHAYAVRLVEGGASAPEIQALLRHGSLTSTQVYLESVNAARAARRLEPIL